MDAREHAHGTDGCVVDAVTRVMAREGALRAVRLDRKAQKVSMATVGTSDLAHLERKLTTEIRLSHSPEEHGCDLLRVSRDCNACPHKSLMEAREAVTVETDGPSTIISRRTCSTAPKLWRWHDIPWPRVVPLSVEPAHEHDEDEWKLQLASAIACAVFTGVGAAMGDAPLAKWMFIAAYLSGGWHAVHEVWERLEQRILDVHFLMLAVAVGSAAIGEWSEGAVLLFLFSFSGALEHYAMGRTQREIKALFKAAPKTATQVLEDGEEAIVEVESLSAGMLLRLKPGEQFPVDAEVTKGGSAADESTLTGEAQPVDKAVGDTVFAGTLNLWGTVDVRVLRPAAQSALQKVIHLIQQAQQHKAPSQRFTDRFGTRYTYAVLALSAVMFFVWWLGFGLEPFRDLDGSRSAFYRTMTLLVVASPCALVLSIPSAILAALAWAARRGILFRGGAAVECLADVDVVALDKTGTLTTGEMQVESIESSPPGRETEIATLAYSMERLSTHPLARAVTLHGKQQKLPQKEVSQLESSTGLGLKGLVEGRTAFLGRREWIRSLASDPDAIAWMEKLPMPEPGSSEMVVWTQGLTGRILVRDTVRPQAAALISRLRKDGLRTLLLTGDRAGTADALKAQLELDEVRAGLKPEDKVRAIEQLRDEGHLVAMIGDGVNDAPSLASAHVAVAMGARGSDAALEQADIILMNDRLENFLTASSLSRRARRIIHQNLTISLGTVVILAIAALAGSIPLTVGVLGHEGSTVVVVLNSLRLLFHRQDESAG